MNKSIEIEVNHISTILKWLKLESVYKVQSFLEFAYFYH